MRNTLMLVVLLAGTYGFAQEQPHISPASEKAGNKAGTWEVPANTEDTILHRMAEENTEYLTKRYQIEAPQKKKQIYEAYRNYLLAEQRDKPQGDKSQGHPYNEEGSIALKQLRTRLKAITGMELDPSLPR